MSTDYADQFSIGRVVTRTFSVIGRNAITFILTAAVLLLPVIAISFLNGTPDAMAGARLNGVLMGVLAFLISTACVYLLQAALVQATITDLNGSRPNIGNALSAAFGVALPVIAISLLAVLGFMAGLILLVIPGLMLIVAWIVAVPVRVVEGASIGESFGRSRALTKGHRWGIFGLLVIYGIIAIMAGFLTLLISGVALSQANQVQGNIPYIVLNWVLQVLLSVVTAVGVTSIYYELRTVKEGVAPQQLAAAFD